MAEDAALYGNGSDSAIGSQLRTYEYQKKALIEVVNEQYFSQLADVTSMPKNMGKTIKKFLYLPLLDDRNINDQGIDAAGSITNGYEKTIVVTGPDANDEAGKGESMYFVGNSPSSSAAAIVAAKLTVLNWIKGAFPVEYALITPANTDADYADLSTTGGVGSVFDKGFLFDETEAVVNGAGNIYGSSKDVGTIQGKLPSLTETGGRKNRVGFKRIELEGTISKFGFFEEYSKESMDFDTDSELEMHVNREMLRGANEITEDAIQIDLLNGAGVIRYAGAATTTTELSGENGAVTLITYNDFMRLAIDLDNNRCPKATTIITGSRMVDTKTIDAARVMYVGSEVVPMLKDMEDNFQRQAFIPVHQYGAATSPIRGEIGSIDQFRIVVVPEMMHWEGKGATVSTNGGYRETGGKYDVFPMLVVGSGSFTTIGFQTDGKTVKFKIKHVKPESDIAFSRDDPYGETGFMSIKWYYGSMIQRPERIALIKTVAAW